MEVSERLANLILSRYALERELGAGGMATVYLARDLRHNRRVALKVLHPELSAVLGPERFLNEIEVTANLQHPHILPLFDSGETEGLLFYVMPYVEGETLRERLERERQLPVADALRIAGEAGDALAYAHRQGLVHRDVKPENILLHEGNALVADFGIVLAVQSAGGERMTQTGLSLGTPQYMAPEQATGERGVDARADIYALGAVVYEMLAGVPPFSGPSSAAVLSRVLTERPPGLRVYRPQVPEHIEAALERALEKLPADRWQSASELAEALRGARPVEIHGVEPGQRSAAPAAGSGQAKRIARRTLTGWMTAAIVSGVLIGGALIGGAMMWPRESPQGIARFAVTLPTETVGSLIPWDRDIAVSADGRRIAFVGTGATGRLQLYVRDIDQLAATQLGSVSDPRSPFLSPDGNWLGYFEGTLELRKISATGGPSFLITGGVGNNVGASWGPDDFIIYANADFSTGLLRVSAAGGEPEVLTTPDPQRGEFAHGHPDILPGGRAVLFAIMMADLLPENARIAVLDLRTGEQKVLVEGGTNPRYASSGHIVYAAGGTLRAIPFDAGRLETRGSPVTVVDRVVVKPTGAANFDLSRTGILAYLPSQAGTTARTLVWVDRQGREEPVGAPPRAYTNPRISPDGSRVALDVRDEDQDIWVWEFALERMTRLTFGHDQYPVWMPDGREIVFSSSRPGTLDLHRRPADGTGVAQRLLEHNAQRRGYSVTPDGKHLVFSRVLEDSGWDLYVLSFDDGLEAPLVRTRFDERNGELSPDGRWLAYQSDISGRTEVYVRPFPDIRAGLWQVSLDGGSHPLWARDGRELFYLGLDGRLMAVPVQLTNDNFGSGSPSRLLDSAYFGLVPGRSFDVSPDGRRFLMIKEAGPESTTGTPPPLLIVLNWFEELNRLVR